MKIAVLSDIHGNIYALEAMLRAAKKDGVEKLLVLGDIVGYYYHPKAILEILADWDYSIIKGNHEEILSQILLGKVKESEIRLKYGSGHRMAIEQLSALQLQLLLNASESMFVEYDGIKILMCHGSPWQLDYYLYPDTEKVILNRCEQFDADLILIGHSHYSFIYKMNNTMLVNCGSIGQSRSLGGHAFWALLNTNNGVIELKSTPYNIQPLLAEIEKIDPDIPYLKNILSRNLE
jgi:putative phosphoesterase